MNRRRDFERCAWRLLFVLFLLGLAAPTRAQDAEPEVIHYTSGSLRLKGFLYKPLGHGPFPAYLWNHGSEQNAGPANRVARFWTDRLTKAVKNARAPIFLLQAQNDFNLGPSHVLGPLVDAKGTPNRHEIFPTHLLPGGDPNDHQQGHAAFFADTGAWEKEVLGFLHDCGER